MTFLPTLPNGYSFFPFQQHRFYEHKSCISLPVTKLDLWQVLEMKRFAMDTPLILLQDYGFNGETKEGKGTLSISRLKEWTKKELMELEEIIGKAIVGLLSPAL